jgi:putative transcriptional regulator
VAQNERITNIVAQLRKDHGLTQEELALAVGVTRQTIISIEKGNYVPSVMLALKIAIRFGCPLEKVFQYEA